VVKIEIQFLNQKKKIKYKKNKYLSTGKGNFHWKHILIRVLQFKDTKTYSILLIINHLYYQSFWFKLKKLSLLILIGG